PVAAVSARALFACTLPVAEALALGARVGARGFGARDLRGRVRALPPCLAVARAAALAFVTEARGARTMGSAEDDRACPRAYRRFRRADVARFAHAVAFAVAA